MVMTIINSISVNPLQQREPGKLLPRRHACLPPRRDRNSSILNPVNTFMALLPLVSLNLTCDSAYQSA
jgi:hypothetical protein